MKKINVVKLGTVCTDKATGLTGTLTHWIYDMGHRHDYLFQPQGINSDDGQPLGKLFLELARLVLPPDSMETIDVPEEILGSQVTDKASGFSGMAVNFVRHINGCFHVTIQPSGVLPKTNGPVRKAEFDLRGCSGEKIIEMTEAERAQSQVKNPSPAGDVPERFQPACSDHYLR